MRLRLHWLWIAALVLLTGRPGYAIPKFAREYHVTCQTCHNVAPRLNEFGLAFQANFYNWPGGHPPKRDRSLKAFPLSGEIRFSLEDNRTEGKTTANFRSLDLYASDGFQLGKNRPGGFFLELLAATTEGGEGDEVERAGALDHAFVGLPLAGKRGQFAALIGQFNPVMHQFTHTTMLTSEGPFTIGDPVQVRSRSGEGFEYQFNEPQPSVAVEYFDRRGTGSADGNYVTLGVPFVGHLGFNSDAEWGGGRGGFLHAFHRQGWTTLGVFGWVHGGTHLEGVMGTVEPRRNLYLRGILANGHDVDGATRRLTLEAEYVVNPQLALTGRLEAQDGSRDDVAPVLAVTYYPLKEGFLRLTAETQQRRGDRFLALVVRGQF